MGGESTHPDAVAEILKRVFGPGEVFEIRALEATRPGFRRPHTEIGYFDYDHIDDAALAVAELSGAKGVYYTPNPVLAALLARAANRIRPAGNDPATKDDEVIARRWLLIDCDPIRPAGISSTDEEHDLAHARAREIREGLASMGWPEPIFCDSGNGGQLMYRVDLPREDDGLVQRVLAALSSTDDEKVQVDQTVFNPSRLWRLPGTMNCRGDHVPDRPHRLARVIDMPERLAVVTREQLEEVAGTAPKEPASASFAGVDISGIAGPAPAGGESFDIDAWIARHCPDAESPTSWKDGRKWIFPVCPFNEAHTNRSAVLIEQGSGAIAFRCHHNGCRNYGWQELRELKEPNRNAAPANSAPIIPAIPAEPDPEPEEETDNRVPDPGPMPEELLRIPGFVSEVMDFSIANAPYPNPALAFCGALALQSYLCGRKVCDSGDLRPNIYLLALAASGTGKDFPRKVNSRILFEIGHISSLGEKFASGEGIQDALLRSNAMLFQNDEMDGMLRQINMDRENKRESIPNILMTLYTSAADVYPLRVKAGQTEGVHIDQPHLTLFGTATPQYFYEALNQRMLTNGFFSRLMIVDVGMRGEGQAPGRARNLPDSILSTAKWWADFRPGSQRANLLDVHPDPVVVKCTPEAEDASAALRAQADAEYDIANKRNDEAGRIAWTRTYENARKLALLFACSVNHEHPQIDLPAIEWASRFATHQTRRQLVLASTYVAKTPFHAECLEIIRILQEAPEHCLSHSAALRKSRMKAKEFRELIDTLAQSGEIVIEKSRTPGRTGVRYRLPPVKEV